MRKNNPIITLSLFVAIGSIALAFFIFFQWNRPLGPSLDLPTLTPSKAAVSTIAPEQASVSNAVITTTQAVNSVQPATPAASLTATSQPLCGGPATMTILAVGSDQRGTGYHYGLADSIHVVRIDFTTSKVMVIDFPRDLWVEIPGISDHYGITHGKINQAYLYGNPGMGYYDGPGEGPGLLARTLDLNFGLRVDHYVAIDTQTFARFIDTIGGLDIIVESPIDISYGNDPSDPRYFLSVGTHHLDGELALALATNRIPTTFQRMKYQKMILSALRDKLFSQEMIPKLPILVAQFITSVQTDLSLNEINSLICMGTVVPKENIQADSFPQEMFTASNIYDPTRDVSTFIYKVDFDKLRAMITQFMNGIWPMP